MLGEGDVIAFDEWVNAINGALGPARLPSITSTTST